MHTAVRNVTKATDLQPGILYIQDHNGMEEAHYRCIICKVHGWEVSRRVGCERPGDRDPSLGADRFKVRRTSVSFEQMGDSKRC